MKLLRNSSKIGVAVLASVAFVTCLQAQTNPLFVDSTRDQLIAAVPDLGSVELEQDQSKLSPLLHELGAQLESMTANLINVSIAEDIHEMRFDSNRLVWAEHRDAFRYVVLTNPYSEVRTAANGGDLVQPGKSAFLVAGNFMSVLSGLLPENQAHSHFRYLGRIADGTNKNLVLAFVASDGTAQGLVWLDEGTKIIRRVRTDDLSHDSGQPFETFIRDTRFTSVSFPTVGKTMLLPSSAIVHARFATGEVHSVHRFSDYRPYGFEKNPDAAQAKQDIGQGVEPATLGEDAIELLVKGMLALHSGAPADALAILKQAQRQLPERIEVEFYLGLALHKTGDLAAAEAQLREVVKQSPNVAAAHNELGGVLLTRGDKPGAVAEFQAALRLQPDDATIRANLDTATKSLGQGNSAVANPAPASTGDLTLKVNVRQVLVPVVVTDRDGHYVTGLMQKDFKVFEDGVEQKITAFSSERQDIQSATPEVPQPAASGAVTPVRQAKRHIYIICLDMMHASFGHFADVRNALEKQFRQEQPGNSQYAIIALGKTTQIVQNVTPDPAKVLETINGQSFRALFQQSDKSSTDFEISRYERELEEVRALCQSGDPSCPMRKRALPGQANQLSEYSSWSTTQFLAQLRSIVEQLTHFDGRRTLILVSDGFLLTPGEVSYGLLQEFFPEFRSTQPIQRMQNAIDPIYQIADKANVSIYTIDSRGLYDSPGTNASSTIGANAPPGINATLQTIATHEGATLSEIAAATGGTAFHNSNDLFAGLEKAFADGREYYMFAYTSSNEALDGKFRKIEVTVPDRKANVNSKRGYWATAQ